MCYRRYSTDYLEDEEAAQDAQAGIWRGEFVPPWEVEARCAIGAMTSDHSAEIDPTPQSS